MTTFRQCLTAAILIIIGVVFLAIPTAQAGTTCRYSKTYTRIIGDPQGPVYGNVSVRARACFQGNKAVGIQSALQKVGGSPTKGYGLRAAGWKAGNSGPNEKIIYFTYRLTKNGKTVKNYRVAIITRNGGFSEAVTF